MRCVIKGCTVLGMCFLSIMEYKVEYGIQYMVLMMLCHNEVL